VFAPGASFSIFTETFWHLESGDSALIAKWDRVHAIREAANKAIEEVRKEGGVGSSLQAELTIAANAEDRALLASLGDDLKFVTITSAVTVVEGDELVVSVTPSTAPKCERCWHWRRDVGADSAHPTICGRCTSNLFGTGEVRSVA
jgi:isoleucyl-tRNA synthetase